MNNFENPINNQSSEQILSNENFHTKIKPLNTRSLEVLEVLHYGGLSDGVLEFVSITKDGGVIESGLYFGEMKPKPIIKISAQVGCPVRCNFCELGDEKFKRNLQQDELEDQFRIVSDYARRMGLIGPTTPLKVNIAGTGEPLFNPILIKGLQSFASEAASFKVSTVFPSSNTSRRVFNELAEWSARSKKIVQMQISLISTSDEYRQEVTGIRVTSIKDIALAGYNWRRMDPERKVINLSLILTADTPVSVATVKKWLKPEYFRFRFRPYVETENGSAHDNCVLSKERFELILKEFKEAGYYVGREAVPTDTELEAGLASNVSRRRMMLLKGIPILPKI